MFSNLNLISTGWLRVQQLSLAKLKQEVAMALGIDKNRIERIQCWPHQLWVVIAGMRARFVSYRILPSWVTQVIAAIGKVCDFEQLKKLGNILRCETENHDYPPEAVDELREAYRQKQNHLKQIQPQLEHEQKAQQWLENWRGIVPYFHTRESLEQAISMIEYQIQEFADLPEIISQIRQIIAQQFLVISH